MAQVRFIPPQLVMPTGPSSKAYGCGEASFDPSRFGLSLDANTLVAASDEGTAVGTFTASPDGTTITLTDDCGGQFELDGYALQAGATPTSAGELYIVVRLAYFGAFMDQTVYIEVTDE